MSLGEPVLFKKLINKCCLSSKGHNGWIWEQLAELSQPKPKALSLESVKSAVLNVFGYSQPDPTVSLPRGFSPCSLRVSPPRSDN